MIKNLSLYVVALHLAAFSFGASRDFVCTAHGKSVSVNGSGLVNAHAVIHFTETKARGLRVLKNISGLVSTANGLGEDEDQYVGNFKIASLTEDESYHPRRYKGYSRFKNFDATDTRGSVEDGMWGDLVVEKDTAQSTFQAHYIFKAGDHMGGTLHLSCRAD